MLYVLYIKRDGRWQLLTGSRMPELMETAAKYLAQGIPVKMAPH